MTTRIEYQILDRRTHRPLDGGTLAPEQVASFSMTKQWHGTGSGQIVLPAKHVPNNVLSGLIEGTAEVSAYLERVASDGSIESEDFIGLPDRVDIQYAVDSVVTHNVFNRKNFIIILGSGNATESRIVDRIVDEGSIARVGVNERKLDQRQSAFSASTINAGLAEINKTSRRSIAINVAEDTGSENAGMVVVHLRDPMVYFDRRIIRSDGVRYTNYGGATAAEYIYNLIQNEVLTTHGDRPAIDASIRVKNQQLGQFVSREQTWTNLGQSIRESLELAKLGMRYTLNDGAIEFEFYPVRDRTIGENKLIVNNVFIDRNDIQPGDIVLYEGWLEGRSEPYLEATPLPCSSRTISVSETGKISITTPLGQEYRDPVMVGNERDFRTTNTESVIG